MAEQAERTCLILLPGKLPVTATIQSPQNFDNQTIPDRKDNFMAVLRAPKIIICIILVSSDIKINFTLNNYSFQWNFEDIKFLEIISLPAQGANAFSLKYHK